MIRTQIYLPKSQLDALRVKARQENVTVSHAIRELIKANVGTPRGPKGQHPLSIVEAAKRVSAAFSQDAPSDLATNMDKYLYESV